MIFISLISCFFSLSQTDIAPNYTLTDKLSFQIKLTTDKLMFKVFNCEGKHWLGISLYSDMLNRDTAVLEFGSLDTLTLGHFFMTGWFIPQKVKQNKLYVIQNYKVIDSCTVVDFYQDLSVTSADKKPVLQQYYHLSFAFSNTRVMTMHSKLLYADVTLVKNGPPVYGKGSQLIQAQVLHGVIMSVVWIGLSACSIVFIRFFKFKQDFYRAHMISMVLANVLTVAMTIYAANTTINQVSSPYWTFHKVLGYILISSSLIAQIIGHLKIYLSSRLDINSNLLIILNRVHRASGYLSLLIAVEQILAGWIANQMIYAAITVGLIASMIIGALVYLQSSNSKLQQTVKISEFKDAIINRNMVVFEDFVYSIVDGQLNHPGGNKIFSSIGGREIDRFIYGMYGIEDQANSKPHLHSARAIQFLNSQPLFRVPQSQNITGDFQLVQKTAITKDTYIFSFKGRNISPYLATDQIGKYYCVYDSRKLSVKRLYTQVKLLHKQNFKRLPEECRLQFGEYDPQNSDISFIVKVYQHGQLSSSLKNQSNKIYRIEGPRGLGLLLTRSGSGNYIIVAAGTGLFPFLDLLWLILSQEKTLKQYKFKLFLRFHNRESVYFSKLLDQIKPKVSQLNVVTQGSREQFKRMLQHGVGRLQELRRVMVCGPPEFNREIPQKLRSMGVQETKLNIL